MNRVTIVQVAEDQTTVHLLNEELTYIGRSKQNDVVLDKDTFTSRRHATIARVGDSFFLSDLMSAHGTHLNGQALKGTVRLKPNDEISVGTTKLIFDPDDCALNTNSWACWKGHSFVSPVS